MKEIVWNNYPNSCRHPTTKYLREQPPKHLVTSDEGCESKHCGPPLFPFLLLSVDFCLHATNANTIQISNPTTKTKYDLWRLCSSYIKIAPVVIEQQCIVRHLLPPMWSQVWTKGPHRRAEELLLLTDLSLRLPLFCLCLCFLVFFCLSFVLSFPCFVLVFVLSLYWRCCAK